MSILKSVYLNELFKLSRKKKLVTGAILFALSVLIGAGVVFALSNFAGIRVTGSSEFALLVLSVLNVTLTPLFITLICIDLFSGEFSEDTMKLTLTTKASRLKVFMGKAFAAATYIMGTLFFVLVLSVIASIFLNGASLNILQILAAYFLSFFPLMVYALLVMMLSNLTKSAAGAFILSIIIFLLFYGLGFVFPTAQSFLFTSTMHWYHLFLGNYVNIPKILRVFFLLMGYMTMLFGLGYYIFEKKEL